MKYTELKDDIKNGARRIYLLEGEDAYFRMKAEEQIKNAFLEFPELNFASYDGALYKGAQLSEITSAMQSFPFMAEKRIIKVTEFYPTENDYEKYLAPVFENAPETAILIIVNSQKGKGVDLKRKKCVSYIDCGKADEETVAKWAYITMKRADVQAEVAACEAIAAYCLADMARVAAEVEKYIRLNKGGVITKADVDELTYKDADYRIYEMTNAVARKNYGAFIEISSDLMQKGFDENAIMSALVAYFEKLAIICSSKKTDTELAKELKMKEYGVKKSGEQARSIGFNRLKSLICGIYGLMSSVRSGALTPAGAYDTAVMRVLFS